MRNDYLHRYEELYGEGGFRRMMREGFVCANHHFSYMPTYTGPGHASVYTGTTPSGHGIVSNNWYDPITGQDMYCAQDKGVKTVGIDNADGQMSPRNLQSTTISDELRLFWNMRSKVVGISLKDRGAILPAGRSGTAYWYSKGRFISSTWYMKDLPPWVKRFNERDLPARYVKQGWEPLLPLKSYYASLPDNNPYERKFAGEDTPTFPKDLKKLTKENGADYVIKSTPYGNTLLLEFARAAIEAEGLGSDDITDLLAVSFSTPDYMGHAYGPRAVEVQDMYLRLDKELAGFFEYLDQRIGVGNYTVFLTADHGGAEVPAYMLEQKLPAGYLKEKEMAAAIADLLEQRWPGSSRWLRKVDEYGLFLHADSVYHADEELDDVCEYLASRIRRMDGIYNAYATEPILAGMAGEHFPMGHLYRGLYPPLAPDVVWIARSGWMAYGPVGTTHGAPWRYDTHAPLLFMGHGVKPGRTTRETQIRDIAPTLSMMLHIPLPSAATGTPIHELLRE
jgi:predicted AlkP superfamily pyrophosphatase or phosphodiesterase